MMISRWAVQTPSVKSLLAKENVNVREVPISGLLVVFYQVRVRTRQWLFRDFHNGSQPVVNRELKAEINTEARSDQSYPKLESTFFGWQ